MYVMHDLRNSGVLCLKKNQTLAVSVKRFKNSEMQKKKSFETEIALRDLGLIHFHGLQSVVSSISLPLFCLAPE